MNRGAKTLLNKTLLILGLGESGLAMAHWGVREGAQVRIADTRAQPAGLTALQQALPQIEAHCGDFSASLLDGVDVIGISPGLAPTQEPQRSLLARAQERAIAVWGEIEFFAQKLAALKQERGYAPAILAITGTNGKTTVTRLTGKLCVRAGLTTAVAGNIGPAALTVLTQALDQDALPQVWVLELSSFQLASSFTLNPSAATILNLSQDHLDWHGDMAAYAAAKARIFAAHTVRVVNRQASNVIIPESAQARVISFGIDAPSGVDSFGIVGDGHWEQSLAWLACSETIDDETLQSKRRRKHSAAQGNLASHIIIKRLMPIDALHIRGLHNASNALAALALCRALDRPLAPLLHALRDYRGEPHRVQVIASLNGVDYIDDSKGTNVGATLAALQGLGQKVVLIAGGVGKGQDFSPLAAVVQQYARAVMLIGKDAPLLRAALEHTGVALYDCASLEQAVQLSAQHAQAGDAVLLSPACASLDMFRDYKHRAQVFCAAVKQLQAAQQAQPPSATNSPEESRSC